MYRIIGQSMRPGSGGSGGASSTEWKPQPDWWDIKSIVENDTEDYPAKAIFLLTDTTLTQSFTQNAFFNADKIVLSDGQEITENGTYTISEDGLKECSEGYKTYYAIVYLKTTTIDFSYTNIGAQFKFCKYIYFYNIEKLNCNSSWNVSNYVFELEAWTANQEFQISGNMNFPIGNANKLQKLPKISLFNITSSMSHAQLVNVSNARNLKKAELTKVFKNIGSNNFGGTMNLIKNTLIDEVLDLEQDLNIIPSKVTSYAKLEGMKEVVELDFLNATSVAANGFCVRDARVVKNIVRSNNYFACSNPGTESAIISRNTLLKVINALADYSEDTEETYVLTLGWVNLAKLTDEEIAIATAKGWTVA